jgi:hypothetical protein
MTEDGKEKALAQIVVEQDCVILYYVGDGAPERIPLDKVQRATISLRDPEGPLVWLDMLGEPEDAPEDDAPEPSGPDS